MKNFNFKKTTLFVSLSFLLTSCEMIAPARFIKMDLDEQITPKSVVKIDKLPQNVLVENKPEPPEIYRGNGNFIDSHVSSNHTTRNGTFTLNFENADLLEVIRVVLNDSLKVNYVIDPKVTGKVSLRTAKPLTKEELLSTLEMLLQLNGAVLIKNSEGYRIQVSAGSNLKGFPQISGSKLTAGSQVRIIPLLFVGAKQMNEILKPILPANALLRVDSARNLIMVSGTSDELEMIEETVNIFDVNTMQGLSFGLFPLNSVDPETINKELAEIFGYTAEGPLEDMFRILPIERLNSILVITPQAQYLDQIKTWLGRLDRTKKGGSGNVHVYRAQHVKAGDLANTLNDIFGQGSSGSNSGKVHRINKNSGVAPTQKSATVTNKSESSAGGSSSSMASPESLSKSSLSAGSSSNSRNSNSSEKEKIGTGEIRIIPDDLNNSVIIVANNQDYKTVRDLIDQIDLMPLQVHIDATILSVTLNDKIDYGVKWQFRNAVDLAGQNTGVGASGDLIGLDKLTDLSKAASGAASGGFSYLLSNTNGKDINAALNAIASKTNVNVVSSPSLMVLNNQEASIQVGDKVPSLSGTAITTGVVTNSIQMIETGVKLTVTPRVNASGVVIMDIEQNVDEATKTETSTINSPTILKRSIKTSAAVDSGETVVLGGLISESNNDGLTGIPLLMDIPVLGELFSATGRGKKRSELVVLITPQVVQNRSDAKAVTQEYRQRLSGIYDVLPTLKSYDKQ